MELIAAAGEVHALLGENGAGKSTLVRIAAGFLRPDAGEIRLDGEPLPLGSPAACRRAGIELVHQHFTLVPALSVAENIELARMGSLRGRIGGDHAAKAREIGEGLGWPLDLGARVATLSVGSRQRVEIIKALVGEPRVLILDEPTATLAPAEVAELFRVMRLLADGGTIVLLIAHKLPEVLAVADRATVLRRGGLVGTRAVGETNADELARLMIGREAAPAARGAIGDGDAVLEVEEFGPVGEPPVSFRVGCGEIFGIGGVDGNGQLALAEALAGVRPSVGTLRLNGVPRAASGVRVGYVPEDRQRDGVAAKLSVLENLLIGGTGGPWLDRRAARALAERAIADFDIRPPDADRLGGELSGGNAQKVVLARALLREPELVVAANPTRGLDLGATEAVHRHLRAIAARGVPVVLFTSDLDELFALSGGVGFLARGSLREGRDPALMSR